MVEANIFFTIQVSNLFHFIDHFNLIQNMLLRGLIHGAGRFAARSSVNSS
jgi:hypothetical protein